LGGTVGVSQKNSMLRLIILILLIIEGCTGVPTQKHPAYVYKDPYHYGILSKTLIESHAGYSWFNKQYNKYIPQIEQIDENKLNQVSIKIFMGTWCHDSKREVPRLYKILDAIGHNESNLEIIGLTKDKKGYFNDYSQYGIINTPTFIFFHKGQEIGRIIERPKGLLESRIQFILDKI